MKSTHTYAVLQVSRGAYDEIRAKLVEAGYGDQCHAGEDGVLIDMHGLALSALGAKPPFAAHGGGTPSPVLRYLIFRDVEWVARAMARPGFTGRVVTDQATIDEMRAYYDGLARDSWQWHQADENGWTPSATRTILVEVDAQ